MDSKMYIGMIIVLLLALGYAGYQLTGANPAKDQVGNIIREIYELQYESPAEILAIDEQNGLYKLNVRFTDFSGQTTTQDVFVTMDGRLITDRFLVTDNYRSFLRGQKTFVECLQATGVRILGQTNDTATLQQLSLLGTYSYKLFASCDGANEETCRNLGVGRYPTTVYNNTGYPNIFEPEFFANLTGCSMP